MADLGASSWSETDASNNVMPPGGWPAGMNPSQVEPTARAMMGAIKRSWDRGNSTLTTGGTSTAYTLTYPVAGAAYYSGEEFTFIANATCGATPSLNVDGLGAANLRKFSGGAYVTLAAGDIVSGQPVRVRTNTSAGTFDIIAAAADFGVFVPAGTIFPYAGTSAPSGYLLCYGQAVSRTTFAALFAVCGTTYGSGDGSTTFNVPDLRGAVAAGQSNMGGSDKGNLSGGTVLGAALGSQTSGAVGGPSGVVIVESAFNVPVQAANNAHIHTVNVVQPTFVLNQIIKT